MTHYFSFYVTRLPKKRMFLWWMDTELSNYPIQTTLGTLIRSHCKLSLVPFHAKNSSIIHVSSAKHPNSKAITKLGFYERFLFDALDWEYYRFYSTTFTPCFFTKLLKCLLLKFKILSLAAPSTFYFSLSQTLICLISRNTVSYLHRDNR